MGSYLGDAVGWCHSSCITGSCECCLPPSHLVPHLPPATRLSHVLWPCSHLASTGARGSVMVGLVSELGHVSALCPGTSFTASGVLGLGGEQGGRSAERRGQDLAMSAGSDLHGGAEPRAGGGL